MQGTLLLIALLLLLSWAGTQDGTASWHSWLAVAGSCLVGCLLLLWQTRQLTHRPIQTASTRLRFSSQTLTLALMVWWILEWDWAHAAPSHALLLLPAILLMNVGWWLETGLQAPRQDYQSRYHMMALRWRFDLLLPLLVILASDAVRLLGDLPWQSLLGNAIGLQIPILLELLLLAVLLVGIGPILARIWRAQPVTGQLADHIRQLGGRMGVSLRGCWLWPNHGMPFYNAMAVGFIHPFRSIFVSDDLVNALRPEQLDAVLGHEMGHLRYHHHLIFMLYMAVTVLLASWLAVLLQPLLHASDAWSMTLQLLALGLYLVLIMRLGFGVLSRSCERQADLAGVACAGSVEAMQQALQNVARLSGQALDAPSWRHHSIAERIAFLQRVRRDPGLAPWHHWMVSMLRLLLILLLCTLAFLHLQQMGSMTVDTEEWAADHPDVIHAMARARQGENTALQRELGSASQQQRLQILAYLLSRYDEQRAGGLSDPRTVYRDRDILRTLLRYRTGIDQSDLIIRNTLAYGLMAGTPDPSAAEIAEADTLMQPIAADLDGRAAEGLGDASHLDTLACVDLRAGRFTLAAERFATALRIVQAALADEADGSDLPAFADLLSRRVAAAENQTTTLPTEWDDTPDAA